MGGKGSGGSRPGAGRPSSSLVQQTAERSIRTSLKSILGITLRELEGEYAEIVRGSIAEAKAGNNVLRKFFMELPFKVVDLNEIPDTPFTRVREEWTVEQIAKRKQTVIVEDHGPEPGSEDTVDTQFAEPEPLAGAG